MRQWKKTQWSSPNVWLNSCAISRHARSRSIESTESEVELLAESPLDVLRISPSKLVRDERAVGMPMKKSGRYLLVHINVNTTVNTVIIAFNIV